MRLVLADIGGESISLALRIQNFLDHSVEHDNMRISGDFVGVGQLRLLDIDDMLLI